MGKGIRRVGGTLANLWYPISIPQTQFRWKYCWNESFFCALCIIWYTDM